MDFLKEVQTTIPKTWHDGLIDHVEYLYFKVRVCIFHLFYILNNLMSSFIFVQSKETGNFPLWYSIDETQSVQIRQRISNDTERRAKVMENTRQEHAANNARFQEAYDIANIRAAIEERMHRDTHKPSELMRKAAATESLRVILRDREKKVQERLQKRGDRIKKVNKEEAFRLINFAKDLNIKLHSVHQDDDS